LPNPGEGGPVGGNGSGTPVIPLPNPGEGGPVGGNGSGTPVIPLPNPGEGGPVYEGGSGTPVIPLPNPGEGGPVYGGGGIPVIPLPGPGQGGPVYGGGAIIPFWPRSAQIRFLNAAFGYQTFRVLVNNFRAVNWLSYAALSAYGRVNSGYQTITVTGTDGYIYIQKTLPFQAGTLTTVAIINTPSGLDLLQIQDNCCPPTGGFANFRVSNLALNSTPLDVLLGDGRVVYTDVRYKETTSFKRLRPGQYQFYFAETNLTSMPAWMDIETLDSAFIGMAPPMETVASLYLNAFSGVNYSVFLLSSGTAVNAVQAIVSGDR
ncbi:DUF4397 domain-containing protein, partial [Oscillibacter sp.]|uniref:DUF4397 domain-containing protein n=1 Tax=Oscillibacter sp. TaxID=1945593 RepID=UPI0026077D24